MRTIMFSLATAALAFSSPVAAQQRGSRTTREFVQAAGQSDTFEMMEAQTALTGSSNPQVLAYARQMMRDHAQTSHALQQATANSGLQSPPMAISADQAPLLSELQSLKGPDFDRAYFRHQVLAHSSALTVERQYAATGDDLAVRRVAASATPVIASHLAEAERMNAILVRP